MKYLATLVGVVIGLGVATAGAQVCNPACASQPAACCAQPQADQFLAEECTGVGANLVHFVIPGVGGWIDRRLPAQFTVSGTSGQITLGDVMPTVVGFHIGNSSASARFQVVDNALNIIGQCLGTSGDTFTGLPALVSFEGRALQVSNRNPLYCRQTGSPDLLCLQVKGQVGPPFTAQELCDPDRVEYICGAVQ